MAFHDPLPDTFHGLPQVCDALKIAKLFPGGFMAVYTTGDGKSGFKNFDFQPGVAQVRSPSFYALPCPSTPFHALC